MLHTEIWSDHHPVCLEWHEETEQTETDSIQKNCGTMSPRRFKRPTLRRLFSLMSWWNTSRRQHTYAAWVACLMTWRAKLSLTPHEVFQSLARRGTFEDHDIMVIVVLPVQQMGDLWGFYLPGLWGWSALEDIVDTQAKRKTVGKMEVVLQIRT